MDNKRKNIIIIVSFVLIIYGLMVGGFLKEDRLLSYSERRNLAKRPQYTTKALLNGGYFEDYEKYILDHFPFRDGFRQMKAVTRHYVFKQKDNNDIYFIDKSIYKMEYPLNENAIINATDKFNEIYDKYLDGMNVSYAIIPDKNYFVASDNGYLSMDYDRLIEIMRDRLSSMKYIDVFNSLELEDYYRTDIHWRQDKIEDVAQIIMEEMGRDLDKDRPSYLYNKIELYPFYGSYYGQAALKFKPDTLVYLTNKAIDEAQVYDHIDETYSKIYMEDMFGGVDSYNLFLSGPKSILTIINRDEESEKELIIFRDSYVSSLAPLLLEGYSKITLIDLRYIMTDLIGDYIDFTKDQDVLFLYNTLVLNNSYMLK